MYGAPPIANAERTGAAVFISAANSAS